MNMKFKCIAMVLMLALAAPLTTASAADTGGKITFVEEVDANGNAQGDRCVIPIEYDESSPGKTTSHKLWKIFKEAPECPNAVYSWYRVDEAPSAVIFSMINNVITDPCDDKGVPARVVSLRSFRQKTTTGWNALQVLPEKGDKEIIDSGGLRIEKKYEGLPSSDFFATCIKITY
ncbi:hypothetical protein F3J44_28515 [Pantoea sp. Tr-811]|uniref:hypothetical protein n=1 Tax=Pantoea sp. Tr-811 TaxID=2608361 RepID=UPI00142005AF|nr:hypothetical protein [Pantoea sp. Tr-811]NIF30285.1 hypothetical protein [Pantoea sp. Tr-811]